MALDWHDFDEDCEHDPDACEFCLEQNCSVQSTCDCGNCCERLILEASLRDAEREPRIAVECQSLIGIDDEHVGYSLNDPAKKYACHFLDQVPRRCTIYESRPLMCRLFDCDAERQSGERSELLCHERDADRQSGSNR